MMVRRTTMASLFVLSCVGGCKKTPAPPASTDAKPKAAAEAQPISIDNPESCKPCHEAVLTEWTESMHANAGKDSDPIFVGVLEVRKKKEGPEIEPMCDSCHSPRSAMGAAGVTCATCHAAKLEEGRLVHAKTNVLYGPNDLAPGSVPAHGSGPAPEHFKDTTVLCMGCHSELHTASGVSLCATGTEWKAGENAQACADCHMPMTEGASGVVAAAKGRKQHRSHRFLGPHRAWYQDDTSLFADKIEVSGAFAGKKLEISLANKTGHAFPTGFPGRMAMLMVVGRDKEGKEIFKSEPDKDTTFNKVYVDAEGNKTLAAFAVKIARDSRLKTGEVRKMSIALPKQVVSAEVKVMMRLVPPPLAERIGLKGKKEAEPRMVASATVERQ